MTDLFLEHINRSIIKLKKCNNELRNINDRAEQHLKDARKRLDEIDKKIESLTKKTKMLAKAGTITVMNIVSRQVLTTALCTQIN